MWVSAAGMRSSSWALDALANDVANVNTPGFKAVMPEVSSLAPVAAYPAGLAGGPKVQPVVLADGGAVPARLILNDSQGGLRQTGQPLDLAVNGSGMFTLRTAAGGVVYTRAGAFGVDANGTVVDGQGQALLGVSGQPLVLPAGAQPSTVSVAGNGVLTVQVAGQTQTVGQVGLALVPDPQQLVGTATGDWAAGPGTGPISVVAPGSGGAGQLASGFLESSNVSLARVLPDVLAAERAYQLNAQALTASDKMATQVNQLSI